MATEETEAVWVLRQTHPSTEVEWEIRNFLELFYAEFERLQSPVFKLNDQRLYIVIYAYAGYLALYLRRFTSPSEVSISAYLGIKIGGLMFKYYKGEVTFNDGTVEYWGSLKFSKMSTLSKILKGPSSDGAMTVVCKVRLMDSRLQDAASQTSRLEGLETLSKNLEELFIGGHLSDVIVKAREREFEAHKLILSSRSPVFKAMLEHKMAESNSGVIKLSDMESEHVEDFLLYLYTGKLHHVSSDNASTLYRAADKYSLDDLKEECRIRLATDMSVDSVLEVIHLATVHDETEILQNGTKFFIENAEEILCTEKWGLFHAQNATIANELLIRMVKGFKTEVRSNC